MVTNSYLLYRRNTIHNNSFSYQSVFEINGPGHAKTTCWHNLVQILLQCPVRTMKAGPLSTRQRNAIEWRFAGGSIVLQGLW